MSDYRFSIVEHNGIRSLHIMIDAEPIAETHIPVDDILEAIDSDVAQLVKDILMQAASPMLRNRIAATTQ